MLPAIGDDLDVIFSDRYFGKVASIQIASRGEKKTIRGIFDNGDVPAEELANVTTFVRETKFQCKSVDVEGVAPDDILTVNGDTYYVAYTLNDGVGISTLVLTTELT